MLSNLKISTKLAALIGLMVAAMLVISGYGASALMHNQAQASAALRMSRDLMGVTDEVLFADIYFRAQIQAFDHLLLRGQDPKEFEGYSRQFKARGEEFTQHLASAREAMLRAGLQTEELDQIGRMHADVTQQYLEALKQFDSNSPGSAAVVDALVRDKDRPLETKMEDLVKAVEKHADAEGTRVAEEGRRNADQVLMMMTGVAALVIILAALLGRILARSVSGPIQEAAAAAERVAGGDLTVIVTARGSDEAAQLLRSIAEMTQNLRNLVGELAERAHTVADTSEQIAQGNVDLSQRTEEQASTLEETASQMEELTSTVAQNADNARQASQFAASASDVASRGGQVVGEVVSTMTRISESSKKISDIIGVIDGIAFQTNILALNAAVEAARAGEQGRGFAVVAGEVRTLAQRSADAAKEIKALIGSSVEQVSGGTRLVGAAGETMNEIVASVRRMSELIAEIAGASQEQSAGLEQINTAVTQMDQVVQQNASLVEEATAATESMKEQSRALLRVVSRFELGAQFKQVQQSRHGEPVADGAEAADLPAGRQRAGLKIEPIRVRKGPGTDKPAPRGNPRTGGTQPLNGQSPAWQEF